MNQLWPQHASHDGAFDATASRPCSSLKILAMERDLENAGNRFIALHDCSNYDFVIIRYRRGRWFPYSYLACLLDPTIDGILLCKKAKIDTRNHGISKSEWQNAAHVA